MAMHELKTWPEFFEAVRDGTKTFEVRKNDRNFQVGDVLMLVEYDPHKGEYTGQKETRRVTYILGDGFEAVADGFCVLALGE